MRRQVTVVIPIHLEEPTALEKISLSQTLAVLGKYPITFQTKGNLKVTWYEEFCRGKASISFERFDWKNLKEYTELMLNPDFYQRFSSYKYILICHLDAFVFRDELEKWCSHDFDYVGSVIYNTRWVDLPTRAGKMLGLKMPDYFANGGFGLRKVGSFIKLTKSYNIKFKRFAYTLNKSFFQDDLFLSQLFPTLGDNFKLPSKELAQQFGAAFEHWDEKDLPFGKNDCAALPFGVHGWFNYNEEFWKPCIRKLGYPV